MNFRNSNKSSLCLAIVLHFISFQSQYCVLTEEYETDSSSNDTDNLLNSVAEEMTNLVKEQHNSGEDNVFLNWAKAATDLTERLWDKLLPVFYKHSNGESNVTQECMASIFKTVLSARKHETWALKFLDSIGKPDSGLLEGSVTSFGNVEECIDIAVESDGYDDAFSGKYCLLYLKPRLPPKPKIIRHRDRIMDLSATAAGGTVFEYLANISAGIYSINAIRLGICVPSNCERWEITPVLTKLLERYRIDVDLSKKCLTKSDNTEMTIEQKVSMALLLAMSVHVLVSTLYTLLTESTERNALTRILSSWSITKNWNQLMYPSVRGDNRLTALHGIKVLTMSWIIVCHTYNFGGFYKIQWSYRNLYRVRTVPESLLFQFVGNGWPLVETFFFLSGLLFIYITLPFVEKSRGKFNILAMILHRLFRMVPSVCGIIAINFLWPLFTSGPILIDDWTDTYVTQSCQNNWWRNLLFINNWSDPDDICLITTWYISADFQLFLLAILVLLAFSRNNKLGLTLTWMLLALSIISSGVTSYNHELSPTFVSHHLINPDLVETQLKYGYFPTYQHLSPYAIGILTGYTILRVKDPKMRQITKLMAWLASLLALLFVMVSTYYWNNGVQTDPITSVLYPSLVRTVWCIALAWITLSCSTGGGALVNKFLSHHMFVPLSRLTFGAYLSHLVVIFIIFFTKKSVTDWTHFDFLCNGLLTIIMSNLMALVLYLLFEAPFANLSKVILKRHNTQQTVETKRWDVWRNQNNKEMYSTNCSQVITRM